MPTQLNAAANPQSTSAKHNLPIMIRIKLSRKYVEIIQPIGVSATENLIFAVFLLLSALSGNPGYVSSFFRFLIDGVAALGWRRSLSHPERSTAPCSGRRVIAASCPLLALLRHADCIERCPLLSVTRKTFAHTKFFSV
jgi:hypothetical protein